MILIVLPNPALDKTVVVEGFETGRAFRVDEVLRLPGGKGFNLARGLRLLGHEPLVVAPLAGHTGRHVLALAREEALGCDPIWVGGETRTNLTVIDPRAGQVSEVNETRVALDEVAWARLAEQVAGHLGEAHYLALCGNMPAGIPPGGVRDLVARGQAAGVQAMLDTYGPQLIAALSARPALVKINQHEAADATGLPVETPAQALQAALELQRRGAGAAIITLGARGAIAVDRIGRVSGWASPQVEALCAVGSGDALFAGVLAGLERGQLLAEALQLGVAAGAANTLRPGAAVLDLAELEALTPLVTPLAL